MVKTEPATTSPLAAKISAITAPSGLPERQQAKRALVAIVVLFALVALPCLLWPMMPHPDERRYSIAAAQMMDGGNWLLPISETGEIRLKKPPLTYWYLIPGFALLGETLAGAKSLFLASALGVISITYALARTLGAAPLASVVGAATVAGHGIFFTTSTQHIPDMPLLIGLCVALWGAIRVLGPGPLQWRAWAALWLGLGWAVLAKGLLPLVLAALVLIVLAVPDKTRAHAAERARGACIGWGLVALVAAGAWFVWVGVTYPDEMMREFLDDQVTGKAGFDLSQILAGLRKTATDLALPALPVLVALALAGRRPKDPSAAGRKPHRAVLLLWLWCGTVVILFAFSTSLYERYILPALPAFGVLLALWASRVTPEALARGARLSTRIWLWLPVTMALIAGLVTWRFGAPGWALVTAAAAMSVGALLWVAAARLPTALVALAVILPLTEIARLPLFAAVIMPTAGQIGRDVEAPNPGSKQRLVLDDAKLVDEIGLMTGGLTRLRLQDHYVPARDDAVSMVYFLDPAHGAWLQAAGFTIAEYPVLRDLELDWPELRSAFAHGDRARLAADHGETLFVATRVR